MAISIASIELRKLQPKETSWISIYQTSLKRTTFETIQHLSVLNYHNSPWNPKIVTFKHYKNIWGYEKTKIERYYHSVGSNREDSKKFDGYINDISFSDLYPTEDILQWSILEPPDIKALILRRFPHLENIPDLL